MTILLFGKLRDVAGANELSVAERDTVEELIGSLEPSLADALRKHKVRHAVNGRLNMTDVRDGDEVAFFASVSGG